MTSPNAPDPLADLQGGQNLVEQALAILNRLRRHVWLALAIVLCAVTLTAVHTLQQPVYYQSTVSLLIESRPPRVVDKVTEVVAEEVMADSERFVNQQLRLMQSEYMASRVEKRLGEKKGALAGVLGVQLDRNAHVVTMSVTDLDPVRARTLVKAFADTYVESTVSERAGVATDASKFLGNEAQQQRDALESSEAAIYNFQKTNELPASSFEDSHKIYSATLEHLHNQLAQARGAQIKLKAQLDEIAAAEGNKELRRLLVLPAAGEAWSSMQARRSQLVEQVNQLETHYGPNHPKLVEAREGLATVNRVIDGEVDNAVQAVRARARANESEIAQLKAAIGEETRKAVVLRQKELEYNRLKRHLEEDRDAYALVAKRQRETELQAAVRQSNVKRLDGPTPASELGRNLPRNVGMAFVVGLVLALAIVLGIDLLDDTIKSPLDAERELKQPLLGVMMRIPVPEGVTEKVEVEVQRAEHLIKNPRSVIAEQCHSFTTQIFSLFMDKPPRALMVVSSAVEDGKTLVAVNLAQAAAARGKRVLLVDADLRRGRLHKLFQLTRSSGLYDVVTQRIPVEQATRRTWIPNVDLITTGDVPEKLSPLRVFEHAEFAAVVEALKARYDLVVFDTPPIPLVSDALILSNLVDGAIGVARAHKTSRGLVRRLLENLAMARVNLVGWVLNDVPEAEMKSKYYYRYGYARGYAYVAEDEA